MLVGLVLTLGARGSVGPPQPCRVGHSPGRAAHPPQVVLVPPSRPAPRGQTNVVFAQVKTGNITG